SLPILVSAFLVTSCARCSRAWRSLKIAEGGGTAAAQALALGLPDFAAGSLVGRAPGRPHGIDGPTPTVARPRHQFQQCPRRCVSGWHARNANTLAPPDAGPAFSGAAGHAQSRPLRVPRVGFASAAVASLVW
ncbi:unnamed protein product, partial [Amoebophrya sp. A120]